MRVVSIRRADRCLAEGGSGFTADMCPDKFQSAVRIAVSLKLREQLVRLVRQLVSIRRADRCLAEGVGRRR